MGLGEAGDSAPNQQEEKAQQKEKARRNGLRGETYGYRYLSRHDYVFVAKNYMPRDAQGELDLVGYDGETLVFVEVRTRTIREDICALPELSVTFAKQSVLICTAQRFLADRRIRDWPCRFDVLAIDNIPGRLPVVRLHKAFSPQLRRKANLPGQRVALDNDNDPGASPLITMTSPCRNRGTIY
jgi:putative endonuclease